MVKGTVGRADISSDEEKPECARCSKGGFHCLGYERHQTWHHTSSAPFQEEDANGRGRTGGALVAEVSRANTGASPPPELSFVAFQNDFCFAALFDNFVHRAFGGTWMEMAAKSGVGLTGESVKALAQAHLGRVHHMPEIFIEGVALYGRCLNNMASEIARSPAGNHNLLIPMILFLMTSVSLDWYS